MAFRYLPLLFFCAALLLVGCGGAPRTHVSGTVTYKGAPVSQGQVTFFPKKGPVGSAKIVDGAYNTMKGEGPGPGSGIVRVEGFDGNPTADQPAGKALFSYEENVELATTPSVKDLVVPVSAPKTPPDSAKKFINP